MPQVPVPMTILTIRNKEVASVCMLIIEKAWSPMTSPMLFLL